MNSKEHLPPPSSVTPETPPVYEPHAEPVEPAQIAAMQRVFLGRPSFSGAIIGGLIGALGGAAAWAGITVATQYQIGFMAIGVGILVGKLVLKLGNGQSATYGVIGALFAMLGCLAGNVLTACWFISEEVKMPFMSVLSGLDVPTITELITASFDGMSLLFYAIAVWEGYKLSYHHITDSE